MQNTFYPSPPDPISEGHEKLRQYRKYLRRLEKRLKDGSFWRYSLHKRRSLLKRVKRLWQQLQHLGIPLGKLAAASAMVAALAGGTTHAQTFTEISGASNPLNISFQGYWIGPSFADIDNDGDLDAFVSGVSVRDFRKQHQFL